MNILIRQEETGDYKTKEELICCAFANVDLSEKTEHKLVKKLRSSSSFVPELSLVAIEEKSGKSVGHVLKTRARILGPTLTTETLALAPVSVSPDFQNKGIGTQLIHEALERAGELGFSSAIVLGHPGF